MSGWGRREAQSVSSLLLKTLGFRILLLSYLSPGQTCVDNSDDLKVIQASMPPDSVLSVWIIVAWIMFGDKTWTDTITNLWEGSCTFMRKKTT